MDFITLNMPGIRIYLLLLIRCSVLLFVMPIFGSRNWPSVAKAGFVLLMALLLYPAARNQAWPFPQNAFDFGLLIVTELMVAVCLGLIILLVLTGIQTGGQLVGFQLGFGIVNQIDPQTGFQQSIIAQFAYLTAILLFLSLNGHHWFIRALADSVQIITPGSISLSPGLFDQLMRIGLDLFAVAIKVMAPAIAVLLFTKTAMGIVAKAVPQIHILIVSFPLTIGVGLFFFGICLTLIGHYMEGFVGRDLGLHFNRALHSLGGS